MVIIYFYDFLRYLCKYFIWYFNVYNCLGIDILIFSFFRLILLFVYVFLNISIELVKYF